MKIGAYAIEQDYSHYVAHAAKTVLAVVGSASKGPVNEAVVCTSVQDLVNKFGNLDPKHYALYAAQYFLSQSSKVYFVRVASGKEAAGSLEYKEYVHIEGTEGEVEEVFLKFEAKEKGAHTNYNLSIEEVAVEHDSASDAQYIFTLRDSRYDTLLEEFNDGAAMTIRDLLDWNNSKYVNITGRSPVETYIGGTDNLFTGGADYQEPSDNDYIAAAQALIADTLDMNIIAVPGVSTYSVITAVLAIAETRGDCLYLVDAPKGLTKSGVADWHNAKGASALTAPLDSSYGALYYDWVDIYDSVSKKVVSVPPSVVVAATYAYSDRTTEFWYAPAGLTRGIVRGALGVATKLNKTDVDTLYSGDNRINAIYEDPQVGLVLWGQKTLQKSTTALNRVNVRRLLNYLKRVVTAACNYLTFEPNDRVTWDSFEMKVQPILENIKSKRGIYEYRIVKGEAIVTEDDIDNYKMPCLILIRPTKTAEEIPIYFAITNTGADFNEVLENSGLVI